MRGKDRPTAPRARQREASRQSLLDAARRLARRKGADPLDPAAVAEEAGVSRPLFYRYFADRGAFADALLAALHEEAGPPPEATPGPEALLGFFDHLARPLERRRALARHLVLRSLQPGALAEARARRRARAVERIAGLLPPGTPQAASRAAFLMDAFLGIQLAWSRGHATDPLPERVRRDMRWAIEGVLGPPARRGRGRLRDPRNSPSPSPSRRTS